MTTSALSDSVLEQRLAALFGNAVVAERTSNPNQSTFPSETVTCAVDGGSLRLHCKSSSGESQTAYGHRGGLAREIVAYRDVLAPLRVGTPRYVGSLQDAYGRFLAIEHVEDGARLDAAPNPHAALRAAAAWAGSFHRTAASSVERAEKAGLPRYEAGYYASWVERTWTLSGPWHVRLPWLGPLCDRAEAIGSMLAAAGEATVIHGEFTPHNVIVSDSRVVPVDWESTAVAFGEIDLAALVDKWPDDVQRACTFAYARARWPDGPPTGFERDVDLGLLYWDFRWLGDRPEWTGSDKVGPRFAHLEAVARRLSLVGPE